MSIARKKLTVVAVDALHRIATVDSAASLGELTRLILRAVGGEFEPARLYAECAEETNPELMG